MRVPALILIACAALSAQSSVQWTKYTVPGTCSDTAPTPCYWPLGQGFTSIVPDPVNSGVLIYADRQAFSGTVTVSGGTSVAWATGDKFGATWGLASGDAITINGTSYGIVQNSATATSLTISAAATNGTFAYSAGGGGSSAITASTDIYDWLPSSHTFGPVYPGGNGTLSQASAAVLLDNPALSWPADRQQTTAEFYDSSRGAMWLTGGVQASRFWNCRTTGGAQCNAAICSSCSVTTWRLNLRSKVWTSFATAHAPDNQSSLQSSAIDTTDQIVLQVGYDGGATIRTYVYCPTDLNGTPGTLTANQTAAGCVQNSGADDWSAALATSGTSLPLLNSPSVFWVAGQRKFYIMGGAIGGAGAWNSAIYTYNPLTKTFATAGAGGGCPMTIAAGTVSDLGTVGMALLANGNIFYHYFPVNSGGGSTQDWIYSPSADTCTQIATSGTGPSYLDGQWGTTLAQDSVTGNVVAWSQGGNQVWEAVFPVPPAITTTALPNGSTLSAYSATISATGSPAPTFSITGGSFPGVTINGTTGALSGTPTTPGINTFTVGASNIAGSDSHSYSVNVTGSGPSNIASGLAKVSGSVIDHQ